MIDVKEVFEQSVIKTKQAAKKVADAYRSTVDKVTGATVARDVESFQQEMETVYSAVVTRILTAESEIAKLNERVEKAERQVSILRWVVIVAVVLCLAAVMFGWVPR